MSSTLYKSAPFVLQNAAAESVYQQQPDGEDGTRSFQEDDRVRVFFFLDAFEKRDVMMGLCAILVYTHNISMVKVYYWH